MINLIGILIILIGTTFEFNLLLTILLVIFVMGLCAGMSPVVILEMIGNAFVAHRFLSIFLLLLPLWGLLERLGLYKKIEAEFQHVKDATAGRILQLYMTIRQVSVALGITLGGHQIAHSLVAPMVLEAAKRDGRLLPSMVDHVKAMIIATENYGNFFGQLLFIASGGSLFVRAVLEHAGYPVSILRLILYAIPTALVAYAIVMVQCTLLDSLLRRESGEKAWRE